MFSSRPHSTADVLAVLARKCSGGFDVSVITFLMSRFETSSQESESSDNLFIDAATGASSGTSTDATSIPTAGVSSNVSPMFFHCSMRAAIASTCVEMSFQSNINRVPTRLDIFEIRDATVLES